MFFPSIQPSSRRAFRNASPAVPNPRPLARRPTRGTFFACCASAIPTHPTSKTTIVRNPTHFRFSTSVASLSRAILDFRLKRKRNRSEEHTSELQSRLHLVCRLLLEKK